MPSFGTLSKVRLDECHLHLQLIFNEVVKNFDCAVICGHRSQVHQNAAYNAKPRKTKLRWPKSKHNKKPSHAVDVAPYPVDWKDHSRFYFFAGYVMCVADGMDIPLIWGGDWDGDREVDDQEFNDLVHYELDVAKYSKTHPTTR
tara:strand:+ start:11090 stop:11521 length:432 start_codon:yes stop_codon:yes gene_type:complete